MDDVVRQTLRKKSSDTTQKGFEQVVEILKTAREVFLREGYARLSMRGVAAQTGITLGAIQHYYKTKDALIEAMLRHTFEEIQHSMREVAEREGDKLPIDQFKAVMEFLIDYSKSPSVQQIYFDLSSLALLHDFAASTRDRLFSNAGKITQKLIGRCRPDLSAKELQLRAALVNEMLFGLMFITGKGRPTGSAPRGLEKRTLAVMVDIVQQPA